MTSITELRGALLGFAALLVLVLLIISVSPGLPGELLLQSLRFHILFGGVALLVALVITGSRWRAALFFIVLLVAAGHAAFMVVDLHSRRQAYTAPPAAEMRVLSYNVLTGNRRAADAAAHIVDLTPDIAIVMETPGVEPYLADIARALPYRVGCESSARCDISLHSRLPLQNPRLVDLWPFSHQRLVMAEVEIDGQSVTVVGIHLSKPYFDNASMIEIQQLRRALANIEGPVILAGDFNAAPWSEPLDLLARDQGLAPPPSHPATWPVRAGMFGVPIDNMFTRGSAQIMEIEAGADSFGSNHRYLLARVGLYAGS